MINTCKLAKLFCVIVCLLIFACITNNVYALDNIVNNNTSQNNIVKLDSESETETEENCEYIFGDPDDENSVFYMVQKVFDYAKIIGPLLVIVLSGYDFAKNALNPDEEKMKGARKKLVTRLICAVLLYFVPLLTSFILNLINNSSGNQTCGIS